MRRSYFGFSLLVWFFTEFPRLSKALVIIIGAALLVGMYLSMRSNFPTANH